MSKSLDDLNDELLKRQAKIINSNPFKDILDTSKRFTTSGTWKIPDEAQLAKARDIDKRWKARNKMLGIDKFTEKDSYTMPYSSKASDLLKQGKGYSGLAKLSHSIFDKDISTYTRGISKYAQTSRGLGNANKRLSINQTILPMGEMHNFSSWFKGSFPELSELQKRNYKSLTKTYHVLQVIQKRYPKQRELIDRLSGLGWPMGNSLGNFSDLMTNPDKYLELTDSELDSVYSDYYLHDNKIVEELRSVAEQLKKHRTSIEKVADVLEAKPDSWSILYPQIFAILESLIVKRIIAYGMDNAGLVKEKKLRDLCTVKSIKNTDTRIFQYVLLVTLKMADPLWKSRFASDKFSRHTVQHGMYNPEYYTYKQFVQLCVLMTTLATFNDDF